MKNVEMTRKKYLLSALTGQTGVSIKQITLRENLRAFPGRKKSICNNEVFIYNECP